MILFLFYYLHLYLLYFIDHSVLTNSEVAAWEAYLPKYVIYM